MLESECDYHDLRNTVRRICDGNGARALELLTLTALDHYESETRKEAVESFIREAVEKLPSLSEEETEEVRDPLMTYRLTSWFIDEFKELVQNRIDDAIIECRDKPKIRFE